MLKIIQVGMDVRYGNDAPVTGQIRPDDIYFVIPVDHLISYFLFHQIQIREDPSVYVQNLKTVFSIKLLRG